MARGSARILDDDEEIDLVTFMLDACGIDYSDFFYNERILTRENLEKNFKFLSKMVNSRHSRRAAYFVIGYLILITGFRISENLRQNILNSTKWEDEERMWLDQNRKIERKIYLKDFRKKIRTHIPNQRLHPIRLIYLNGKNDLYTKFRADTVIGINEFQKACNNGRIYYARHINLQGWGLKEIPKIIFKINNLESLCIEYNQLKKIPEGISKLTSLKVLYLDYNNFKNFPESVTELTVIEVLSFDNNYISQLPESINKLKSLKTLYIRKNRIDKIPAYLKMRQLKILSTFY